MFKNKTIKKKELIKLLVLVFLSLGICFFFLQHSNGIGLEGVYLSVDSINFMNRGKDLAEGNIFGWLGKGHIPPFVPFMIATFSLIFKNIELSGRLVSIFFNVLLIFPTYYLAKKFYNKDVAFISVLLVIFHPLLIKFSTIILSASTYTFLVLLTITLTWITLKKKEKLLPLVGGFTLGLITLTNSEGIFFIFPILVWFVYIFNNQKVVFKKILFFLSLFLIGFFIIYLPYALHLHTITGEWKLNDKTKEAFILGRERYNPYYTEKILGELSEDDLNHKIELEKEKSLFLTMKNYGFKRVLKDYFQNVYNIFKIVIPILMVSPILIFFLIINFLFIKLEKDKIIKELFLLSFLIVPLLFYPLFAIDTRYFMPAIPILFIWIARGIKESQNFLIQKLNSFTFKKTNWYNSFLNYLIIIIILLTLIKPTITEIKNYDPLESLELKEAGFWLKNNSKNNNFLIMSRRPQISYYAEGGYIMIPYENHSKIFNYAYYHDVDYVVIDEKVILRLRPNLLFLLNESNVPEELKLIYKIDNRKGHKIMIYKLIK